MLFSGGRLIVKFGGSSIRDNFREAVTFVSRLWDENEVVVVVSALKGVTDFLISFSEMGKGLEDVKKAHVDFARRNDLPPSVFSEAIRELKRLSRGDFPSFEAYRDHVLSYGEWLSGIAFAEGLRRAKIPVELFKPWEIIETDGNFGNARVNLEGTSRKLGSVDEALDEGKVAVVPGFVGSHNGLRTTLGREGSDYTAAVLGRELGARGILVMSDVEGIYTADPSRVVSARLIPFVSYGELYAASKAGMRAVHHRAVEVASGIPIVFGRTSDWRVGTVAGYRSSGLPILVHRVEGNEGVITVVGLSEVPGYEGEGGYELGIPWVRIRVPKNRLGRVLTSLHRDLVGPTLPRSLSIVQRRTPVLAYNV